MAGSVRAHGAGRHRQRASNANRSSASPVPRALQPWQPSLGPASAAAYSTDPVGDHITKQLVREQPVPLPASSWKIKFSGSDRSRNFGPCASECV
jgi:hypothetical protein